VPGSVPGDLPLADARFDIDVTNISIVRPEVPEVHVHLACGTARDAPVCDAVARDRYALLQPRIARMSCVGGPSPDVAVRGTPAGHPIRRGYDTCERPAVQRWLHLLRRFHLMQAVPPD
jgi:hypothetical protein